MQRALLLDRDGTICEESNYLDRPERLRLLPGSAEAIRLARSAGFLAVVVTNQSGIARGMFDESDLERIHARLAELLAHEGAELDGIYHCPHHPEAGRGPLRQVCDCRKPEPGLLLRAREELGIELDRSYAIGDRLRDLEAGWRVGARGILVLIGNGREEFGYHSRTGGPQPAYVASDLLDAVEWIVREEKLERRSQ